MNRDRRSAEEENLHRSFKPCRAEEHLNQLLEEKRKLKKKNLALREERDRLENDIQRAIERTRDVLHMKKVHCSRIQSLLMALENSRLDKNTPNLRLLERQRCLELEEQLRQVNLTLQQMTMRLENIELEYQANVKRYDEIVLKVGEVSQQLTHAEACVVSEINNLKAVKAVNFDNEKMRRLLQEEKNVATKTQLHEHKSYEERQREYNNIKGKLNGEESKHAVEAAKRRQKASTLLLYSFLKSKVQNYYRKLLTYRIYVVEGDKSIKCLDNLAKIGQQAGKHNLRSFFAGWYRKAFQVGKVVNLNEKALAARTHLKSRIKTMSTWNEQFNRSQLTILNDYEKGRMLNSLRLQLSRKELHLAFNRWRSSNNHDTYKEQSVVRMAKLWNRYEKRVYFRYWKCEKDNFNRYIQNHTIQQEFNRLKSLGRAMRRWRFSTLKQDSEKGQALLSRNEMRQLVNMRLRYLRRKAKLITILNIKGVRNELRSAFYRYWCNVFSEKTVQRRRQIDQEKTMRDDLRTQLRTKQQSYLQFRKQILTRSVYKFMYKKKGLAFMDWYNATVMLRKRAYMVYSLLKRRDTSQKLNAMNRFRKNQRDFEKKQMHAVLTDLNKKMEAINEKSTEYREKLQLSIHQLGELGAHKIDALVDRNTLSNMKAFFERFRRKAISHGYRTTIKRNVFELAHRFLLREAFTKIGMKAHRKERSLMLKKLQLKFIRDNEQFMMRRSFEEWRKRINKIKKALHILENYETLYFFYRTVVGWRFIKQKVDIITNRILTTECKNLQKNLQTRLALLDKDSKEQSRLEHGLKDLMIRFIRFETLSQNNKTARRKRKRVVDALKLWRSENKRLGHLTNTMMLFGRLLERKSMKIFMDKAQAERYRATNYDIKEQMSKLAKKRKTFEEKSAKSRMDVTRRLESETAIYEKLKHKMEKRIDKHDKFLEHIRLRNIHREKITYMGGLFYAWKQEYMAVKRLFVVLDKNQYWDGLRKGLKEIKAYIKLMDDTYAREIILGKYMEKKNQDLKRLAIQMFRYKIRANAISQLNFQIREAEMAAEHNKEVTVSYAPLIAKAKGTFRTYTLLKNSYMKFKKYSKKRQLKHQRIADMNKKVQLRIKADMFKILNWRRYFKQTSRDYVQTQLNRFDHELLRDSFLAWKQRHDRIKWACNRISSSFVRDRNRNLQVGFLKVRNLGLYNRDVLNQKRSRALTHILKKKVADEMSNKQTFLYRWHFLLTSRHHYMVQILDTLSRSVMLSPFYRIREHAFWNPYYINKHAEKAMNENKTQTKADMNLLLQENIDPEQIKGFMKNKNAKDTNTIRSVVGKLKVVGEKPLLLRAWHSWREYLNLKHNIKKALTKMFIICDGKGKYWNRWRGKDQKFVDTLKKESRGNMVGKYHDLVRLLKEYRRDVKTNIARTQQLASINHEYEQTLSNAKFIALRSMSHFVRTGMSRTLRGWRQKIVDIRQLEQNYKFDTLGKYIEDMLARRQETLRKVTQLQNQNLTLRESCMEGGAYANMLKELLYQKERLSIVLADKKHNMKILLEDNLKIKQKLKNAQEEAIKLISEFEPILKDRSHEEP